MPKRRVARAIATAGLLALLAATGLGLPAYAQDTARMTRDGRIEIAGRRLACEDVEMRLDRSLPNLGAAAPDLGLLILNPFMLRSYPRAVQLFVFHHECGHHRVGEDELDADCWAVGEGVRGGWLDRKGLGEVCESFEDAPETSTHPSGRRRCRNLDRCFAEASTRLAAAKPKAAPQTTASPPVRAAPERAAETARAAATTARAAEAPRLVEGPQLLWSSEAR